MGRKKPHDVEMTAREMELMAVGKPVVCPSCRETSYLFPKGVGYQPYIWEMNCGLCYRHGLGLNAYLAEHAPIVKALERLRRRYLDGAPSKELASDINGLAEAFDHLLDNRACDCGGELSISACPKCLYCDILLSDSYFHFADELPPGK